MDKEERDRICEELEIMDGGDLVALHNLDVEDRREMTYTLHNRGYTMRDISAKMLVSVSTVKRDIDKMKVSKKMEMEDYSRHDFAAGNVKVYDDVIIELWRMFEGSDKDTKIKLLNSIRGAANDKRKALQDTGIVKKETAVAAATVNLGIISNLTAGDTQKLIHGFLAGALTPGLPEPEPPEPADLIDISMDEDLTDD